jgi:hypothetical protein
MALAFLMAIVPSLAQGQGVTTGAIEGTVTSQAGDPIADAVVEVVFAETGYRTTGRTSPAGRFLITALEPGAPYTVFVRAIGYRPVRRDDIRVALSQTARVDFALEATAVQLQELVVMADPLSSDFSSSRTGAQTSISDSLISRLPTLNRDFADFVILTPQVAIRDGDAGGIVAAGQNNRFNTIQVDGATVNDRFGLGATGQTGGQANGRSVGIEAVKEYQVLLAPYDVRQGNFTGALINAVTKTGTNELKYSGFFYYRSDDIAGDPLSATAFNVKNFGASIGGPVVRDKSHFFINAEFRRANTPANGPYLGSADQTVVYTQTAIDAFNNALGTYGLPNSGSGDQINNGNPLTNVMVRYDSRISDRSRLVVRYNYNEATRDQFSRSSSTNNPTIDLSTVSYGQANKTHNPALQFFTNWENGRSNELLLSWNRIRDARDPAATAPLIIVQNFTQAGGSGTFSLQSGTERFSQGNELDQDIFEITDNLTIPLSHGHVLTVGTRNELYKVRNLFAQGSYGVWTFDNLSDFVAGDAERFEGAGELVAGNGIDARFTAGQLGAYAQDQWQVNEKLAFTVGLRADMPFFTTDPTFDAKVVSDFGPQSVPGSKIQLSPRLGFNYNASPDGRNQIRGGFGMFTGTPAYVWYANVYANNGTKLGRITCGQGAAGPVPAFNPQVSPPPVCGDGTTLGTDIIGEVNLIDKDTKFPQVLRGNLAWDRRLPGDVILTVEGIYTKGINDFFIVNRNLNDPVGVDRNGRTMYGTIGTSGFSSPSYFNVQRYGPSFNGGVFELRNTSSNNWSMSGTIQLRKRFAGDLELSGGYTRSKSKDVQSFTSSRAISNWRFGRMYSASQLDESAYTSDFDRPHRVVLGLTKRFNFDQIPVDVSATYQGQSGIPYTLGAGFSGRGDLNADGTNNDPIYIPTDATDPNEMIFVQQFGDASPTEQAQAFEEYIAGESCLNKQRGQIMERNSCRNPWQNFLNLGVRVGLPEFSGHQVALDIGVFNVLNLLNGDWGVVKTVGATFFSTPTIVAQRSSTGGSIGTNQARFEFEEVGQERFRKTSTVFNSYQIQLGLRVSH